MRIYLSAICLGVTHGGKGSPEPAGQLRRLTGSWLTASPARVIREPPPAARARRRCDSFIARQAVRGPSPEARRRRARREPSKPGPEPAPASARRDVTVAPGRLLPAMRAYG